MKKTYKFIGNLAIALYGVGLKMSYSTLISVLKENDIDSYGSERGMARGIAAAYHEWEAEESKDGGEPITCKIIAKTFVNKDGYPSWLDY